MRINRIAVSVAINNSTINHCRNTSLLLRFYTIKYLLSSFLTVNLGKKMRFFGERVNDFEKWGKGLPEKTQNKHPRLSTGIKEKEKECQLVVVCVGFRIFSFPSSFPTQTQPFRMPFPPPLQNKATSMHHLPFRLGIK
jgi:hypothetical protein